MMKITNGSALQRMLLPLLLAAALFLPAPAQIIRRAAAVDNAPTAEDNANSKIQNDDDHDVKKDWGAAAREQKSNLRPIQLLDLHYEGDDHDHHHDHDGHDHHHHHHDDHHHHHDDDDHHDIDASVYSFKNTSIVKERIHDPLEDPEEPETAFLLDDDDMLFEAGRDLEQYEEGGEPIQYGRRCSSVPPTPEEEAEQKQITAQYRQHQDETGGRALRASNPFVIEVHWHIMLKNNKGKGNVTEIQVSDSMDVLNLAFAPHGFVFVLKGVQRVKEPTFFNAKPSNSYGPEDEMKQKYRTGDEKTLNVYTGQPGGGLLGWATFPFWYHRYSWGPYYDGVVIRFSSVVGGTAAPYNLGGTLIHEVGHWLGLYHTFQDGCNNVGDGISDTPFHSGPTHGCPTTALDTCPDLPGNDPIKNYMNYLQDACMTEFSVGQGDEMNAMWCEFRDKNCHATNSPTSSSVPTRAPILPTPLPTESPQGAPSVYVTEIVHRIVRTGSRSWRSHVVVHANQPGVLVTCNFHDQIKRRCRTSSRKRCFCGTVVASNRLSCYGFNVDRLRLGGHNFDAGDVNNYKEVCR